MVLRQDAYAYLPRLTRTCQGETDSSLNRLPTFASPTPCQVLSRLIHFKRRPCAGRHLLFFAAAKKSRQKKAAHTASPCSYPRALNVPTLHTAVLWSVLV